MYTSPSEHAFHLVTNSSTWALLRSRPWPQRQQCRVVAVSEFRPPVSKPGPRNLLAMWLWIDKHLLCASVSLYAKLRQQQRLPHRLMVKIKWANMHNVWENACVWVWIHVWDYDYVSRHTHIHTQSGWIHWIFIFHVISFIFLALDMHLRWMTIILLIILIILIASTYWAWVLGISLSALHRLSCSSLEKTWHNITT